MIETQLVQRTQDIFPIRFPTKAQDRAAQLRQVLTQRETRLFGIELPYDYLDERQFLANSVLGGATALLATTFLFVAVGYLATLGLPDPGYAAVSAAAAHA